LRSTDERSGYEGDHEEKRELKADMRRNIREDTVEL
jgi:hypothetical protein